MIVGARVDFRLIHGQVGNLWANARQVSRFMVVDDQIAEDATQKQVLRMATPATCKLSVLPVEKAAANITSMDIVKSYSRNLNCGQDDVDALTELKEMGIPMVIQLTPQDNPVDFSL